MSPQTSRPKSFPAPGWSKLPIDDAAKVRQDNAASDARRKGASTIGPSDAVVQIHELPANRFSTTLNGDDPTEHDTIQEVLAATRQHLMNRQLAAKRKTMSAVENEQDNRGNAAGDATPYANM